MNKAKRAAVIAGNWKMNKSRAEAKALVEELRPLVENAGCGVVVCTPYLDIETAVKAAEGSNIKVGAQNCHWADHGAFTGEIPAEMLREAGAEYDIIGHSERRQFFGETDEGVACRVRAALDNDIVPIVCIGESLAERESGKTFDVVLGHLVNGLASVKREEAARVVVAYEPVWAIGTGKTATPDQAQEVHAAIRAKLNELFGAEVGEAMRIQYGGSVKASNAKELLGQKDIDGALVGGASLVAEDFAAIIKAAI